MTPDPDIFARHNHWPSWLVFVLWQYFLSSAGLAMIVRSVKLAFSNLGIFHHLCCRLLWVTREEHESIFHSLSWMVALSVFRKFFFGPNLGFDLINYEIRDGAKIPKSFKVLIGWPWSRLTQHAACPHRRTGLNQKFGPDSRNNRDKNAVYWVSQGKKGCF